MIQLRDIVLFIDHKTQMPVVGEVVGFTKHRVRIAYRVGANYQTRLRAHRNVHVHLKAKRLV